MSAERPGFVYLAANPYLRENVLKIGFTSSNVEQRLLGLRSTGLPGDFAALKTWYVADAPSAERKLHILFCDERIEVRSEFFILNRDEAIDVIDRHLADLLIVPPLPVARKPIVRPLGSPPAASITGKTQQVQDYFDGSVLSGLDVLEDLPSAFMIDELMEATGLGHHQAQEQCAYWDLMKVATSASSLSSPHGSRKLFFILKPDNYPTPAQLYAGVDKVVPGNKIVVGLQALRAAGWYRQHVDPIEVVVDNMYTGLGVVPSVLMTARPYRAMDELIQLSMELDNFNGLRMALPEAALMDHFYGVRYGIEPTRLDVNLVRFNDQKTAAHAARRCIEVGMSMGKSEDEIRSSLSTIPSLYAAANPQLRSRSKIASSPPMRMNP